MRFRNGWILIKKFFSYAGEAGYRAAYRKAYQRVFRKNEDHSYDFFISKFDTLRECDFDEIKRDIDTFKLTPLISVVMPVYNTNIEYLRLAIESVLEQVYVNWELCIADDASTHIEVRSILHEYALRDSRIKVVFREVNGHIALATNSALDLAQGEYVALMDHDDLLPKHALYMVAREINHSLGQVDLIYTDEDKIDGNGRRYDPYFKMDWNPVMIETQNYFAHLGIYRASIAKSIGGFRSGFEGSQDYDFLLRFLKCTNDSRICHIPHVLYHWRIFSGNHTFSTDNMSVSDKSACKALREYFSDRPGIKIWPIKGFPGCWNITWPLPEKLPLVSIVIPTRNQLCVIKECISSICNKTQYVNYEIIIVDNDSTDQAIIEYFACLSKKNNIHVLKYHGEFNYAAINNAAAAYAHGEYLLFLNNDIEIICNNWLTEMVCSLQRPNVAVVGAKLLYKNNHVQHGGVTIGIYGVAGHIMRHLHRKDCGYFGQMALERNVSAVTGACLLIKKGVFNQVDGFDDEKLKVSYNDVDLCLKVRNAGYQILMNPRAELYHFESISRGADDTPAKKALNRKERHTMYERYGVQLFSDPFYSANLSLENETNSIAATPRVGKPWRNWVEFVCPFHRGDVVLGIQVANTAWQHGIKLRMHVSEKLIDWVSSYDLPFPIEPIPVEIPKGNTYELFLKARDYVALRPDSSGVIVGNNSPFSFDFLGIDIVEHMLHKLGLPIYTKLVNILPSSEILEAEDSSLLYGKSVLLHPFGGWDLKSMPKWLVVKLIDFFHNEGFKIIQVGGKSDAVIEACDGWILKNKKLGYWRTVFETAGQIVGVDSWTSHFAASLDMPQVIFFGPTTARDVCSKRHFKKNDIDAMIFETTQECAPCHTFNCLKKALCCQGFIIDESMLKAYINRYIR